jgi:chitin disaccharide deacetylase
MWRSWLACLRKLADVDAVSKSPPGTLAICVDDFGLHSGVNAGVFALAAQGRISATSCLVNGPSWAAGASVLRTVDPQRIDVGLHLDLTEQPFDSRLRQPVSRWIAAAWLGRVDRGALRQEIETQLDHFESAMGRPPSHVDGHEHVHQFPIVRELLMETVLQRFPKQLPWLRSTQRAPGPGGGAKALLIETLGCAATARLARAHGFAQNWHLLGVYDFQGTAAQYQLRLSRWLAAARHGDLLMCHASDPTIEADPLLRARLNESQVLASDGFAAILEQAELRVAPLSRMPDLLTEWVGM